MGSAHLAGACIAAAVLGAGVAVLVRVTLPIAAGGAHTIVAAIAGGARGDALGWFEVCIAHLAFFGVASRDAHFEDRRFGSEQAQIHLRHEKPTDENRKKDTGDKGNDDGALLGNHHEGKILSCFHGSKPSWLGNDSEGHSP